MLCCKDRSTFSPTKVKAFWVLFSLAVESGLTFYADLGFLNRVFWDGFNFGWFWKGVELWMVLVGS